MIIDFDAHACRQPCIPLTTVPVLSVVHRGVAHRHQQLAPLHARRAHAHVCGHARPPRPPQDPRPGEEICSASGAPEVRAPCARNSFVILPYKAPRPGHVLEPEYPDAAVHYGQKVRLALHPAATGNPVDRAGGPAPLMLFSKPITTTHYSKYSRAQLVGLTARDSYDCVWQVGAHDALHVPAHAPVPAGLSEKAALRHAPTLGCAIECLTTRPNACHIRCPPGCGWSRSASTHAAQPCDVLRVRPSAAPPMRPAPPRPCAHVRACVHACRW